MFSRSVSPARLMSGRHVGKGFVDDKNAVVRCCRRSATRSRSAFPTIRPSGLFGLTTIARFGIGKLADVGNDGDLVPASVRRARMLRIGRAQDRGASRLRQRRHLRQQDLRARRGHHVIRRRRAIGPGRGRRERRGCSRGPAAAKKFPLAKRAGPGMGPGMGIDPGRKIDERFRRAGKHPPRGGEIAAMRQRLHRRTGLGPNEHRSHLTGPAH